MGCGHYYPFIEGGDTAFTVDTNTVRYGPGVLGEIGDDAQVLGITRAMLLTDAGLANSEHVAAVRAALAKAGVEVIVYDAVTVEPTDASFLEAARFAAAGRF